MPEIAGNIPALEKTIHTFMERRRTIGQIWPEDSREVDPTRTHWPSIACWVASAALIGAQNIQENKAHRPYQSPSFTGLSYSVRAYYHWEGFHRVAP